MTIKGLSPRLDLLRQEYVLVQAWKKTASYIRYHNWFTDPLELDRTAVNLPTFLAEAAKSLEFPEKWKSDVVRIVPAPKSQHWQVTSRAWQPVKKGDSAAPLRSLCHLSLKDQVIATALMMCLADRVETAQGDPRKTSGDENSRKRVISYGNRLFCDVEGGRLRHRWGSGKLYRAYYQDYQAFLARPVRVADSVPRASGQHIFVVHSDLRQFYDRVRPSLLAAALRSIEHDSDDEKFFELAERVLDWTWHSHDAGEVAIYAQQADLNDFTHVALPQGLVSAGFFANVVLLAFDDGLRAEIGGEIAPGVRLQDACRYVDDLRIVVTTDSVRDLDVVNAVTVWLTSLLEKEAPGLEVSTKKTTAAEVGSAEYPPVVRQSTKMKRIQSAVSGGFDAIGGQDILDTIQGLIRSQEALSRGTGEPGWQFSPIPDVRDETVARFAAARFRTTYRSIRPLLEDASDMPDEAMSEAPQMNRGRTPRSPV